MPWVEIDASQYDTFAEAIAAADAVKYTTGSVILLPGLEGDGPGGEYVGTGLRLPHNTHLFGTGEHSRILSDPSDPFTVGSVMAEQMVEAVRIDGDLRLDGARNQLFSLVEINGTVCVGGPSYYWKFDTCKLKPAGSNAALIQNANGGLLSNCWIVCQRGIVSNKPGLVVDDATKFEGAASKLYSFVLLNSHECRFGGWYERVGSNEWVEPTIDCATTSWGNVIDPLVFGYLATIVDRSRANDIRRRHFETRRGD